MKIVQWIWPVFFLFACENRAELIPKPYGFPRIDLNDKSIRRDTLYCSKEQLPTVLTMVGMVPEVQEGEIRQLKECFQKWQEEEIRSGRIVPYDSCNWNWVSRHQDINDMVWGFPDSSEFQYSYGDLNQDHRLDQMVTFVPGQCDGGNASIWVQLEVITISLSLTQIGSKYL
jgi:hypothetical protein